ncbi:hypothetical protein PFISCL1PPCAC_13431, partial [Pristionchus fissidentatus]
MTSAVPSIPIGKEGARLPLIGLGTWLSLDEGELRAALKVALDAGYRLIDTAALYGNELVIGDVLHEYFKSGKLTREEVFVTTKLPYSCMEPKAAEESIKKQLATLCFDYVDLFILHHPCAMQHNEQVSKRRSVYYLQLTGAAEFTHQNEIDYLDTWKVLEKYCKSGQLKAIGLSNFNAKQVARVCANAEIKPSDLQVELHIYWPQHELQQFCSKQGMTLTSFASLGSPGRLTFRPDDDWPVGNPMEDTIVVELSKKYNKTPAQILLRHLIQRGISVIPKSTNPSRVLQNIDIFNFEISAEDQQKLLDVKSRVRLFEMRVCGGHAHYPFEDVDLTKKGDSED